MTITGIALSAEEITEQKGCFNFEGEDKKGAYDYTRLMNSLAGIEITLEPCIYDDIYDYVNKDAVSFNTYWRKGWLRDIKEGVDWSKVPVDAKIIVTDEHGQKLKRHFAKFMDGKVYFYSNGETSWTYNVGLMFFWSPDQVELVEEK